MNTVGLEPHANHQWEVGKETPIFRYEKCSQCGKRRVVILDRDTRETFDRSWLNGGMKTDEGLLQGE